MEDFLHSDSGQSPAPPSKKRRMHFLPMVLIFGLLLMLSGEIAGSIVGGMLYVLFPMSDGVTFLMENYFPFIGIDFAVLFYCGLAEKDIFRSFAHPTHGGGRGNTVRLFLLGLLLGFLMNGACILAAYLHGDITFYFEGVDLPYLLLALVLVFLQSGAEELLTRGYMMGALRERYGAWIAIAVNSLFFGALHLGNPGVSALAIVDIVIFGLALSVVMYYLESLWLCIAVHTAWNYTQNIIFGLPNSGLVSQGSILHLDAARDSLVYNTAFGVEGTILAVSVECLLLLAVVLYGRKKHRTCV